MALQLGCTVAELLGRVSSAELAEWMAYEKVTGPLGADRADQQAAVVASTIANAMRSKGRAYKVEDFVPRWGPKPERSSDELLSKASAIFTAMGGVDLRGDHSRTDDQPPHADTRAA